MKPLNVAVVQFTPEFGNKTENLFRIGRIIEETAADIVIFPELCTTGYFFSSRKIVETLAEPAGGDTGLFFKGMAKTHNKIIIAGFAEKDNEKLYNSCLIASPEDERLYVYRKIHLFYKEKSCFDPGNIDVFVYRDAVRDISIAPMICYDWRFPEISRIHALLGADLIVCPSNLVTDIWRIVMPARAIENKCYIAVANRAGNETGGDETLTFTGRSAIYAYNGVELAKAGPSDDEVIYADIYPHKTRDKSFNPYNDILKDRQPRFYRRLID